MKTLTRDLLDHIATARDGDDHARLVLADHLEECGEHDRAEVMRLGVWVERDHPTLTKACNSASCIHQGCAFRRRESELTDRNPAWLSVPCPECKGNGLAAISWPCAHCDGTGDLLANAKPTIARGFVTVTLPSALCWQRRCEVCGTSRWGRGDGCVYCDGACGPKVKDLPHPVLAAVLASPVGPWVRRVVVSDRVPDGTPTSPHDWYNANRPYPGQSVPDSAQLPEPIFDLIDAPEDAKNRCKTHPTAESAVDALARAVPLWSRDF